MYKRQVQDPDASYALGSVLNHVCLHQTIIGQEALKPVSYTHLDVYKRQASLLDGGRD